VTIISAQIPTTTRDELERLAREADRSLSAEVRRALAAHLNHERREK
jgi:predicted transcriptional regulator